MADSSALDGAVSALLDALRSERHKPQRNELVEICESAVELQRLRAQVQEEDVERRLIAMRAASRGGGLNPQESVEDRLKRAAMEIVTQCGFDRAVVTRFHNGRMEMYSTYFRDDEAWAADCHGYAVHHPAPDAVPTDWPLLILASIVAAVVSFIAVKWLLRYVQSHTFVGFGIYRIVVGVLLLVFPI